MSFSGTEAYSDTKTEILKVLAAFKNQKFSDRDIITIFQKNPPPPLQEFIWYSILADHFFSDNRNEAAIWFQEKLFNSKLYLDKIEHILKAEKDRSALEPVYISVSNLLSAPQTAVTISGESRMRLRSHLRASLSLLITGKFPTEDFDLVFINTNRAPFVEAFLNGSSWEILDCLFDSNDISRVEKLSKDQLVVLWCSSDSIFYVTKNETFRILGSIAIEAAASVCHQIAYPAINKTPSDSLGKSTLDFFPERDVAIGNPVIDAETLLEAKAIAQYPIYGQIMSNIFQVKAFESDQVKAMVASVSSGGEDILISGLNSQSAYQNLIGMYCFSNGYSNDFLSWLISLYSPPYIFLNAHGVLGALGNLEVRQTVSALRDQGYFVFPHLLSQQKCDALLKFALQSDANLISEVQDSTRMGIYNRQTPQAHKYTFPEDALLGLKEVQQLICDPSIIGISQEYLGTKPSLGSVSMWWNTAFSKVPSSAAAQLYHFDMDRIKWIKWFIYLTDVSADTGPHTLIAKSHRRGRKPPELLNYGYSRLADEAVERHYPLVDRIEVLGKRGTIIAADTRYFHKGKLPTCNDRLILEFEYANSLFGGEFDLDKSFPQTAEASFHSFSQRFPHIFRRYNLHKQP